MCLRTRALPYNPWNIITEISVAAKISVKTYLHNIIAALITSLLYLNSN